jgi:hypothetical protein
MKKEAQSSRMLKIDEEYADKMNNLIFSRCWKSDTVHLAFPSYRTMSSFENKPSLDIFSGTDRCLMHRYGILAQYTKVFALVIRTYVTCCTHRWNVNNMCKIQNFSYFEFFLLTLFWITSALTIEFKWYWNSIELQFIEKIYECSVTMIPIPRIETKFHCWSSAAWWCKADRFPTCWIPFDRDLASAVSRTKGLCAHNLWYAHLIRIQQVTLERNCQIVHWSAPE